MGDEIEVIDSFFENVRLMQSHCGIFGESLKLLYRLTLRTFCHRWKNAP